jgi:hypothetical protein
MSLGGSKSKQTSQSQESFNRTTTPTAPGFITNPIQGIATRVSEQLANDTPFVAGPSALQQQAFSQASNLQPSQNYGAATGMGLLGSFMPSERASAATFSREGLNERMNPFLDQVMGAFTADNDVQSARARAQARAMQSVNGGAFNSTNAFSTAQLEDALSRARGAGIAGIQSDAYRTALGSLDADNARQTAVSQFNANQSQADLQRLLSGAGLVANVGQAQGADQRANIGLVAGLGEQQRGIENAQLQADTARDMALAQILATLTGTGAVVGQNQTGTGHSSGTQTGRQSGWSVGINDIAKAAAMAGQFSDRRLKTDIEPVRTDGKGRQWYCYRYVWDEPGTVREGVMAQEVAATDPQAVSTHESGFLMVDYGKLEAA